MKKKIQQKERQKKNYLCIQKSLFTAGFYGRELKC